jgi:GAF domain-containing protein
VAQQRDGLVESLVALSQVLVADGTLETTLEHVASLACRTVEGCDMAGVTMMHNAKPVTAACSDPVALAIDEVQYATGQGPCLQAYRDGEVHRIADIATEERWPEFCAGARAEGLGSSLSLPLSADGRTLGALNLYSRSPQSFGEDIELAQLFAHQASVAIANAELYARALAVAEQLQEALESRDVIGQAKGILMATTKSSADAAFDVLRAASQRRNMKLRAVAEEVVLTGEPPDRSADG